MTEEGDQDWNKGLKYCIRLIIKHPNIDPTTITKNLTIAPVGRTWRAGTSRQTPKGDSLPGVYRESAWSHSIDVRDKRSFFDEVIQLLDKLEPKAKFLSEIMTSGGTVLVNIDLFGDRNIRDSLSAEHLRRLGALGIELGVEVF